MLLWRGKCLLLPGYHLFLAVSKCPKHRTAEPYHSVRRWFIINSPIITNMDTSSKAFQEVIKNLSSLQLGFEKCWHPLHLLVIQSNTCCSCTHNKTRDSTKRVGTRGAWGWRGGCGHCCSFIASDNCKGLCFGVQIPWWDNERRVVNVLLAEKLPLITNVYLF